MIFTEEELRKEWILWIGQEANFCARTMLIPRSEFIKVKQEEYNILKRCAKTNAKYSVDGSIHLIDNLLLQNVIWKDGIGKYAQTETTEICSKLTNYADGTDYYDDRDESWYKQCKIIQTEYFNCFTAFKECKKTLEKLNVKVVDAFLCVESDDGKIRLHTTDTVKEYFNQLIKNEH